MATLLEYRKTLLARRRDDPGYGMDLADMGKYAAVHDADPLDDIVTNRFTAGSLNPLHDQGMTVAALQAIALRHTLAADGTRVPHRFSRQP
jgi:hypothetical protein